MNVEKKNVEKSEDDKTEILVVLMLSKKGKIGKTMFLIYLYKQ